MVRGKFWVFLMVLNFRSVIPESRLLVDPGKMSNNFSLVERDWDLGIPAPKSQNNTCRRAKKACILRLYQRKSSLLKVRKKLQEVTNSVKRAKKLQICNICNY